MTDHDALDSPGEAVAPASVDPAAPVRVHVTGFEPFGGARLNASWQAVRRLPDHLDLPSGRALLARTLLPVTFRDAPEASRRIVVEERPDVLLHIGEDAAATAVALETTAVNRADAPIPDNAGSRPRGEELVPGGAERLDSPWHAGALVGRLRAAGHRVVRSQDAGLYVCNATLYAALDAAGHLEPAGGRGPLIGFVHVPRPEGLEASQVRATLTALIIELVEQVRRGRAARGGAGRLSVPRGRRTLRVGLTGGIGSGKSTVAGLLAGHGAHVVDADRIAREVLEPGAPALAEVRDVFGPAVITADGSVDRGRLAAAVFSDAHAREQLEAITLPRIAERAARAMEEAGPTGVAVYDVPLLAEGGMADLFDCVVVVEAPLNARLTRLANRGMARSQALERMAHQATDDARRRLADVVVPNAAGHEELARSVAALWGRLRRAAGDGPPGPGQSG